MVILKKLHIINLSIEKVHTIKFSKPKKYTWKFYFAVSAQKSGSPALPDFSYSKKIYKKHNELQILKYFEPNNEQKEK